MAWFGKKKGNAFEVIVEQLLSALQKEFPNRVQVRPQAEVKLRDGRSKFVDFEFNYELLSSQHCVALECRHRDAWSADILDKILTIRTHSFHNRFWFVFYDDNFLSENSKRLLDAHGVMHFSLGELKEHLNWVRADLQAAEQWRKNMSTGEPHRRPPSDPAMLSR
jgi:hypothetical protein